MSDTAADRLRGTALRRVGALLAVCAAAVLGPAPVAQAAQASPSAPQAVQNYAGCLNGQKAGDLLLLIDESKSLLSSDPAGARVTAAKSLLNGLATQADHSKIDLDVQVAGFATVFDRSPSPWTPLSATTLPGLLDTVSGFTNRNRGGDTDYWMALEGARRSLTDQAKAAGATDGNRCQAIAWFSDGKLDIQPRDTLDRRRDFGTTVPYADGVDLGTDAGAAAAQQAARTSLCRAGGQADGLRTQHIVMFGIGLTSSDTQDKDFDLMRSISTGAPLDGQACGKIVDPSPGTFQPASDLSSLLFAFEGIFTPEPPVVGTICAPADTSCRGREFVLDESIDGFHVLGEADPVPGLTAELVGPDGAVHRLDAHDPNKAADLGFGPVKGTYTWHDAKTVTIDINNPGRQADGWTGVWNLRFVDPNAQKSSGTSRTSLQIWGDVEPSWVGWAKDRTTALPAGSPDSDVRLGLAKADGTPVPPESLRGTFSLSADLVDPAGKVHPVASNLDRTTVGNPTTLDLTSVQPGQARLRLTLDLTTASATRPGTGELVPGTRLSTQLKELPFTVEPPLGYPKLPPRIEFAGPEGATELTATMPVTGPGCVWVPSDAATTVDTRPDGVSSVTIAAEGATTPQNCLVDGQTGTVTLHLSADHEGNGTASGTLPISIAPRDRPDKVQTVAVPFSGDLRTQLNPASFWLTLIAALLLGPGIPIGLLYLAKWLTAKIPGQGVYAEVIPVTVAGTRTLRDGAPFAFRDTDFRTLADIPERGTRRFDVEGVELRTRIGWSPFGAAHVAVKPRNTQTVCLAPDEEQPGRGDTARLPLALYRNWVVLHDVNDPPDTARVLVLVGAEMSAPRRADLAAEIAEKLPEVLDRLRSAHALAGDRGTPPDDHGGWSGGPDPTASTSGPAGPSYGPVGGDDPGYGGQPQYGQPQYGQPQYSQPEYGQPRYGQPEHGGARYGEPQHTDPMHGTHANGGPAYGAPASPGPGPDGVTTPFGGTASRYGGQYGPAPESGGTPTWDGRPDESGTRPLPDEPGGHRVDPPDPGPIWGPTYGPRS